MPYVLLCFAFLSVLHSPPVAASAVDYERQAITIALLQEPPNLDTTRMTDLVSGFVIGHVGEGLLRYDRRGQLAPGVAESWQVAQDRITYRLRADARWSDGSQVTAADFVYAWRLIVDPKHASPYATIMYPVKNAEKVHQGALPVAALGVRAIDDQTLLVELESPCGFCTSLMVHAAFYPIKEAFRVKQGEAYAAEASNLLYNGPFKLVEWVHGGRMLLTKNDTYWGRDQIILNSIDVAYITEDNRARLNLFRDNRIALVRLGSETVNDAVEQGQRLRTFASGGLAYLRFNVREGRMTRDPRIRRAVQGIFDADEFVNKVIGIPGYKPAYSFFPGWIQGVEGKFVDEYPSLKPAIDYAAARSLVMEALRDQGLAEAPAITLLSVTSSTGAKIAEYLQGLLQQRLGIDVKVDQQTLKQYLDKSRNGQFDIVLSSWYPDFDDILTYADLLASWNPNNRGDYRSEEYDRNLQVVMRATAARTRMDAAAELQRIIRADVPVLPMAETGSAYLQHEKLRGVVRRVLGADPDYTWASVAQ